MSFHEKPNTFVTHVHLLVRNLNRSDDFYQNLLGLRVLQSTADSQTYTADGKTPLITVQEKEGLDPHYERRAGLYHFAILLPSRKDLAMVVYHLLKESYPLQGGADHAVSEAVYLADPDGNGIELYRDRPENEWQWTDGQVTMPTVELDSHLLDEREDKNWEGIPEGTILGHLHLQVADLRAAERFYCEGLGFQRVAAYSNQAYFISTGGYHHHIGLNTWMSLGRPASTATSYGMSDFTITFPDHEVREKAVERLKQLGYRTEEKDGRIQAFDPSNLVVYLDIQ